jgi:sRNA-binding regulator protein Hfq
MKRTLTTLFLALAIGLAPFGPSARARTHADEAADAGKVKNELIKRLNKKETRVKIKLRNGSEVNGRITQTSDNSFTIANEKTGSHTEIAYDDVLNVEGRGMSKKKKIVIASAIGVGILVTVVVIAIRNFDPFENGITIR